MHPVENVVFVDVYIFELHGKMNISLRGWGSLTMIFTGKFVYTAHHFSLLRLKPFDLSVDKEGWWFEHSVS